VLAAAKPDFGEPLQRGDVDRFAQCIERFDFLVDVGSIEQFCPQLVALLDRSSVVRMGAKELFDPRQTPSWLTPTFIEPSEVERATRNPRLQVHEQCLRSVEVAEVGESPGPLAPRGVVWRKFVAFVKVRRRSRPIPLLRRDLAGEKPHASRRGMQFDHRVDQGGCVCDPIGRQREFDLAHSRHRTQWIERLELIEHLGRRVVIAAPQCSPKVALENRMGILVNWSSRVGHPRSPPHRAMPQAHQRIRDIVDVHAQPTVVRLEHLDEPDADWISDQYYRTADLEHHLRALSEVFGRPHGCGVFVIGPYGSGKSHLLAYVTQQLRARRFTDPAPHVVTVSLVNFGAHRQLEAVIGEAVGLAPQPDDRSRAWADLCERHEGGLALVIDELSEFLRSKPAGAAYHEDVRFVQFLGEWAADHRLWILAAMQEQIELTGALEHGQYRKIKDRYPLRLILSSAHVRDIVAERILDKRQGYGAAVARLQKKLDRALPKSVIDLTALARLYPLHPTTIDLLEEIRGSFSHARGIVEFVVTRLRGDPARGIAPFLDEPIGHIVTPDVIVEHFRDLLGLQPEFLPLAQIVLPHFERRLPQLFEAEAARRLAERIVALLVLTYVSPMREGIDAPTAAAWLAVTATQVDPSRNVQIVAATLARLVDDGHYVRSAKGQFVLDFAEQGGTEYERLLAREVEQLQGRDTVLLELAVSNGLRDNEPFNPLGMRRDAWQGRIARWHFHDRPLAVWVGNERPGEPTDPGLCIRLPWGEARPIAGIHTIIPAPMAVDELVIELCAVVQLAERPLRREVRARVEKRRAELAGSFAARVREAFSTGHLVGPRGIQEAALLVEPTQRLETWIGRYAERILADRYPSFARFAPMHGPLSIDHYRDFLRAAFAGEWLALSRSEALQVIREGYLVPMQLLQRRGRDYAVANKFEQRELVRKALDLLRHEPTPQIVYRALSEPVYGLVPDQIHLLLLVLVVQGEIDLRKDGRSIHELFETLPKPIAYDAIDLGHGLPHEELAELQRLCGALGVAWPDRPSIAAQRRAIEAVRQILSDHARTLGPLSSRLQALGQRGAAVRVQVEETLAWFDALEQGSDLLGGFSRFLVVIGSTERLIERLEIARRTPDQIERQARELARLEHLLSSPRLAESPIVSEALRALGEAPAFDHPEALQRWLGQVNAVCEHWAEDYRARHDAWWSEHRDPPALRWEPPAIARSTHLGLAAEREAWAARRERARGQICRGVSDLRFQSTCMCGFDGSQAPVQETLQDLEDLRIRIETAIRDLLAQPVVRERLAAAERDGAEVVSGLGGLEDPGVVPTVHDVAAFDRIIAGAELVQSISASVLHERLGDGVWDRDRLSTSLLGLFREDGPSYVRFLPPAVERDDGLLAWVAEQVLEHGVSLPETLAPSLRANIGAWVQPTRVSDTALRRLDQLGLPDAAIDEVLRAVVERRRGLPDAPRGALLSAAAELVSPSEPKHPRALADLVERLYRLHPTLLRIGGRAWLTRLDALARADLEPWPPALVEVLRELSATQWIVIDALGLPLLPMAERALPMWFPTAQVVSLQFAMADRSTTTDAFYRSLAEAGRMRPLHKIDAVDQRIHGRLDTFAELVCVCEAELDIAFRRLRPRLDPTASIVVLADHGFRLEFEGRGYEHGGPSTLERIVPIWRLEPKPTIRA